MKTLVAQGLDVLQRNTNTLIELISDLLDTSRIVAATLTMEFKEVDLKQVVRASVETWRVQAAEKGIAVAALVEIPETVSPCLLLVEFALAAVKIANRWNSTFFDALNERPVKTWGSGSDIRRY